MPEWAQPPSLEPWVPPCHPGRDLLRDNLDSLVRALQLGPSARALLRTLAEASGPLGRNELARRAGLARSNVGVSLRRLAARIEALPHVPGVDPRTRARLRTVVPWPRRDSTTAPRFHVLVCEQQRDGAWNDGLVVAYRRLGRMPEAGGCVGRERTLTELMRLFGTPRWVTLVGRAGIGKSTVARAFVHRPLPQFEAGAGGVWWIDTSRCRSGAEVLDRISETLTVVGEASSSLSDALRARGRTLLILDDLDGCTGIDLAGLLHAVPQLSVLVTRRTPMNSEEEVVLVVPTLTDPHAEALCSSWGVSGVEAERLVGIWGGYPLALKLAVAGPKAHSTTLEQLLFETCDRLSSAQWEVLCACAHFAGGIPHHAVQQLVGRNVTELPELVLLGLLERVPSPDRWPRYEMLPAIRAHVRATRPGGGLSARHASVYAAWCLRTERLQFHADKVAFDHLRHEVDNLRAALLHATTDEERASLSLGLFRYLMRARTGAWSILAEVVEAGRAPVTTPAGAWLTLRAAWLDAQRPDTMERASEQARSALEAFTARGDRVGRAVALYHCAAFRARTHRDGSEEPARLLAEAEVLAHELALPRLLGAVLYQRSQWAPPRERARLLGAAAEATAGFDDPHETLRTAVRRGSSLVEADEEGLAMEVVREAAHEARLVSRSDPWVAANGLSGLAVIPLLCRRYEEAVELLREATRMTERMGLSRRAMLNRYHLGLARLGTADLRGAIDDLATVENAWRVTRPGLLCRVRDLRVFAEVAAGSAGWDEWHRSEPGRRSDEEAAFRVSLDRGVHSLLSGRPFVPEPPSDKVALLVDDLVRRTVAERSLRDP